MFEPSVINNENDINNEWCTVVVIKSSTVQDPSMFGPSDVAAGGAVSVDGPNGELAGCFLELAQLEKKSGSKPFITGAYKKVRVAPICTCHPRFYSAGGSKARRASVKGHFRERSQEN